MQGRHERRWLNEYPPSDPLRQYLQSTSGHISAGTTSLHSPMAVKTSQPEMHWLSGYPVPMSAQPHPTTFSSIEYLLPMRYQNGERAGFGPLVQMQPPLPYGDIAGWITGQSYMPNWGYRAAPAGSQSPRSRPGVGDVPQKRSKQAGFQASREELAIPRGPPRKPKRSGYALWVGNLPVNLSITKAKNYFSTGATQDIESVFLISPSNCAFVNYRTREVCRAARTRFHGSQLDGKNLVCRERIDSAGKIDDSPCLLLVSPPSFPNTHAACTPGPTKEDTTPVTGISSPTSSVPQLPSSPVAKSKVPEKFIILKSLTVSDLEASVRQNTWTTQLQNQAVLDKALDDSETVYLIFSANKSGEYFGYAQLVRPMSHHSVQLSVETALESTDNGDCHDHYLPRSIATPATATAPRGRIVDDSARGTLFWEAAPSDDENDDESILGKGGFGSNWDKGGKAFAIEWLSTTRVPFYRTRGLRNPWNENRKIKIARDGTEVEPRVGRRLLNLFTLA